MLLRRLSYLQSHVPPPFQSASNHSDAAIRGIKHLHVLVTHIALEIIVDPGARFRLSCPAGSTPSMSMTTQTTLKPFNIRVFYTDLHGVSIPPTAGCLSPCDRSRALRSPASLLFPTAGYNAAFRLASRVWRPIQTTLTRINRDRITVCGRQLPQNEAAIIASSNVP